MRIRCSVGIALMLFSVAGIIGCSKNPSPQTQHAGEADTAKVEEFYTCPMHPSVRSDRPGACPVCSMALVKKSGSASIDRSTAGSLESVSFTPTQRVMANVSVVMVKRKTISRTLGAVGIVAYAEPNYQRISMRFPGRLEQLHLSYTGQAVRRGDPVAEVYSPEAISAQQEYLLALNSEEQASAGEQTFAASAMQFLEQAKEKLLQWGFTERQVSRLKETRKVNYRVTIFSPVSGVVVKKNVDPQQYVSTGQDMFEIADLSTVWAYLDVYEKDLRFISRGQNVEITTSAYPYEKFTGRVTFVDPIINPDTRTVRVRTEFSQSNAKLKPNMFVRATIAIPRIDALVVPSTAVLSTGKRTVVWVEVKENTFEPRDVVIGSTSDGFTIIAGGIEEGEHIVEAGGFLIDSESQLSQTGSEHKH